MVALETAFWHRANQLVYSAMPTAGGAIAGHKHSFDWRDCSCSQSTPSKSDEDRLSILIEPVFYG